MLHSETCLKTKTTENHSSQKDIVSRCERNVKALFSHRWPTLWAKCEFNMLLQTPLLVLHLTLHLFHWDLTFGACMSRSAMKPKLVKLSTLDTCLGELKLIVMMMMML